MTDKEIKRLHRAELIEIIYEFQKNQEILQGQVKNLRAALAERQIKIREAGSIAEAALKINEVFEKAQAAADQYLASIQNPNFAVSAPENCADTGEDTAAQSIKEAKIRAAQMEREAQKKADAILQEAKAQQEKMIAQTDAAVAAKWKAFQKKVETALKASPAPLAERKAILDYLREIRTDDTL